MAKIYQFPTFRLGKEKGDEREKEKERNKRERDKDALQEDVGMKKYKVAMSRAEEIAKYLDNAPNYASSPERIALARKEISNLSFGEIVKIIAAANLKDVQTHPVYFVELLIVFRDHPDAVLLHMQSRTDKLLNFYEQLDPKNDV